jgi:type IV secretory pathway TraG/TraD family ATPase VirD4
MYKELRNAPEETGQSFLSSANVNTFLFNLRNLQNLTCCDNIHLETLGDEKTALFIIISATDTTYNFMAAMMYTRALSSRLIAVTAISSRKCDEKLSYQRIYFISTV